MGGRERQKNEDRVGGRKGRRKGSVSVNAKGGGGREGERKGGKEGRRGGRNKVKGKPFLHHNLTEEIQRL